MLNGRKNSPSLGRERESGIEWLHFFSRKKVSVWQNVGQGWECIGYPD